MKQVFLALGLVVTACSSTSSSEPAVIPSPLEACSGAYHCTMPDHTFESWLHRDGGVCMLGGITLDADGTAHGQKLGSWSGNAAVFTICEEDVCRACEAKDAAPASPSESGACTGTPDSCSRNSPPNCSDIRGCRMESHIRYDGSFDNSCTGSPDPCSEMTSERRCLDQGCQWQ